MSAFALLWHLDNAPFGESTLTQVEQALPPHKNSHTQHITNGNCYLVSNGEVIANEQLMVAGIIRLDNRDDLLSALKLTHHTTDLEIALAAWQRWGSECADYLYGDFSFVIADLASHTLYAARDALGVCQLFFHHTDKLLAIASDSCSLASYPPIDDTYSRKAIWMWLQHNYDDRYSMFEQINGLKWGEALQFDGHHIKQWRYWQPENIPLLKLNSNQEYEEQFRELLAQSVKERCHSKSGVIGTSLSGGMDSSSVTALANRHKGDAQLIPFSFKFPTLKECDESELCTETANYLNLEPHWVDSEKRWLFKNQLTQNLKRESPFAGWEAIDRYVLQQLSDKGGDTLLTGHGGDNLTTGISERVLLGTNLRSGNWHAGKKLRSRYNYSLKSMLWRFFIAPSLPTKLAHRIRPPKMAYPMPSWITESNRDEWEEVSRSLALEPKIDTAPDRQAMFEMMVCNLSGIRRAIHYYNRLGAEYDISVRHPFVNRRLVEYMLSIPQEQIRPGKLSKAICRNSMKGLLPKQHLNTLSKPTLSAYYHHGINKEKENIYTLLETSQLVEMGFINQEQSRVAIDEYINGDQNNVCAMFIPIIYLESWLKTRI